MTDTPGDTSTGTTLTIDGATITEALDLAGDHDWYRVTLVAGQTYVFTTASLGGVNDTSVDTTLSLRNAAGVEVRFNDDYANPPGYFSRITFTATTSGTYYLDVGGYNDGEVGGYTVKAQTTTLPVLAVYTNDQIASQLTNGYWGGASHHFNVAPGGTLTVNVTALGATEQTLALNALALWTDATGIAFQQVASGAQITFTNTQAGAFANASFSGGITSSATVNVESSWVTTYGSGTNSYSFQTYIHEIGHALGLGHGGNYNGSAAYPDDALYANDAWVTTIMSYFDPKFDNTYFGNQGFSYQFTVAPMAADVIAVNNLYGVRTTTRTGDTTYGFNNTSGRDIFDASLVPGVAVTVIDDGGNDTLDYSGFSQAQTLNLNPEAFSSTGGRTGNLVIARGSVIENAIGGSGNDSITGNAVANSLSGGLGNDTMSGGEGNDTLDGGGGTNTLDGGGGNDRIVVAAAGTGASVTGGTGTDVLAVSGAVSLAAMTGIEAIELSAGAALTLTGSQFNNGLPLAAAISSTGSASITVNMEASVLFISKLDSFSGTIAMTVNGTTGTDIMKLGNVAHTANGGDGIDQIKGGSGADTISGGAGIDRINGAGGADVLTGGADADVFKYANLSDSGIGVAADHITDFVIGTDRLNFVKIDPDALTAGDQAFAFIGTTAFHASGAAEIRYLSSGGNIVVQVDADGNGTADMEIVLNGLAGQTLTSAEFAL